MTKTTLITGCTTGIGLETARALAEAGQNLILVSRSEQKLKELQSELKVRFPSVRADYFVCNFENLQQVSSLGKMIEKTYPNLDVLVNNAGIWETKARNNEDGFEMTWVVNYFAPFILTSTLMPLLKRTAVQHKDARIINLSSDAHRFGKLDFHNFFHYTFHRTYGTTKLANLLHTLKLARDLKSDHVTVHAIHPGVVATGLWRRLPSFVQKLLSRMFITSVQGAKTTVLVATLPLLPSTGIYWDNEKPAEPKADLVSVADQNKLFDFTQTLLAKYL